MSDGRLNFMRERSIMVRFVSFLHTDIDYVGVASYFTCILTGEYICIGNV